MTTLHFILAILAILLTHWVGAIAVYGSTLLALPLLVWLVDLETARTVLILVGSIQAVQVLAFTWRDIDWPQFGRMVLWAGCGLPIGMLALQWLPETPLLFALGLVLVVAGVSRLLPRQDGQLRRCPPLLLRLLLFVGGIIHGAFAAGGATVVVYAQQELPAKPGFRATLSLFWVAVNSVLVVEIVFGKAWQEATFPLLAAAIPVVIFASWHANRIAVRMDQARFASLVSLLLILAGLVTLIRLIL